MSGRANGDTYDFSSDDSLTEEAEETESSEPSWHGSDEDYRFDSDEGYRSD